MAYIHVPKVWRTSTSNTLKMWWSETFLKKKYTNGTYVCNALKKLKNGKVSFETSRDLINSDISSNKVIISPADYDNENYTSSNQKRRCGILSSKCLFPPKLYFFGAFKGLGHETEFKCCEKWQWRHVIRGTFWKVENLDRFFFCQNCSFLSKYFRSISWPNPFKVSFSYSTAVK